MMCCNHVAVVVVVVTKRGALLPCHMTLTFLYPDFGVKASVTSDDMALAAEAEW